MSMKLMQKHTALEINNIALKRLGSSWTGEAAEPEVHCASHENSMWETYRSDQIKLQARELLAYLNTL